MLNRYLASFLTAGALLLGISASPAMASIYVYADTGGAQPIGVGFPITFTISTDGLNEPGDGYLLSNVNSYSFHFSWDPTKLDFVDGDSTPPPSAAQYGPTLIGSMEELTYSWSGAGITDVMDLNGGFFQLAFSIFPTTLFDPIPLQFSGELTFGGDYSDAAGVQFSSTDIPVTVIPEPASIALVLLALVGMAVSLRGRGNRVPAVRI